MKIYIPINLINIILAFIAGAIFYNVYNTRWQNEPFQVISCFFCMIYFIFIPQIIIFFYDKIK